MISGDANYQSCPNGNITSKAFTAVSLISASGLGYKHHLCATWLARVGYGQQATEKSRVSSQLSGYATDSEMMCSTLHSDKGTQCKSAT
jgi:hypothetical protein